jgi:hypothetical protein
MKTFKKLLWASVLVFVFLVSFAAPAFAATPLDGRVVFGDSFTLEAGQVLDGDLVVFGGSVTLEEDSRVGGDVAVLGGSADVAGAVTGDLVVFGGSVDLASTAVVDGELIAVGGQIDRQEGAVVRGNQVEGLTLDQSFRWPTFARVWTNGYRYNWGNWLLSLLLRALRALATVVLITIIGALVAIFLPQSLGRASQAVLIAPAHSWLVGFLTVILAALVGGFLVATLCLAPFGGMIWLAILIAGVFGWIALGLIIGLKVLERFRVDNVTPVMGTIVGGVVLSLITATLWIVAGPCLGWPFVILIGSFGLGAVVMTRFGTQEYVPAPPATGTSVVPQPPVSVAGDEGEFAPVEVEETEETTPESADDAAEPSES